MEHLDHVPARRGLVIFLNGTSSSGKSSIAAELLRILDEPYFHLPVDAFHAMRSRTPVPPDQIATVLHRTWRGFHRAVAGMAAAGNNVVVDHVLSADWRLRDCLSLLVPQDVVLVKVHCSPEELERRERARGDRPPGLAAGQLERVHAHAVYDMECDTSDTTPRECAGRIKDFLRDRPSPTAFEQLRDGRDQQLL
ncbi:chloramphenicol phosphotransferase CPT family protein [Streptomyces viridochromogenes]|uniref:chloramphenicol phosphotransferase CPT family protein n=1 Tax=Streptomyces viridochromogenes TaxID=1938 RepID=UPI00069FBC02|nr:AAA family ATPase [Streptomyces viridochromogenes]KOG16605.1 chloramphenicol phosphotransferase [Streptomyces viridochromogenes]KOG17311.1 chloramphenicol phosphotransferase [Streptomyces viridochromogenes]